MEFFINFEIIDRRVENIKYCTWGNAVFALGHKQRSFLRRRSCRSRANHQTGPLQNA